MSTPHTSGEWFVNEDIHGQMYVETDNSDRPFICDMQLEDEQNETVRATILADAELIASAPVLLAERDTLKAENNRLREALRKIAFDSFGAADASHEQVLVAIENFARDVFEGAALAAGKGEMK